MTEDANNQEITQAYRDLATETTPVELDDEVLRKATLEARSRYGVARAWVRPVAWAATIGLSLAIVLEVFQVIPPALELAPAAVSEGTPEPATAVDAPAHPQREKARHEGAAATPSTVGATMDRAPANPGGGGAEELGARRSLPQELPEATETRSVVLDDVDAFAAGDMRILEEAEAQARQRAGEPGVATFAAVPSDVVDAHCDETARESAESWYECIEELRDAGNERLADSELAALVLAFPDFEVPAPSK